MLWHPTREGWFFVFLRFVLERAGEETCFVLLTGGAFLFERPKRNRKSRHRFGAVDADQRNLSSGLQPKANGRLSRSVLLPALPCRPGDTVLPRREGCHQSEKSESGREVLLTGRQLAAFASLSDCKVGFMGRLFPVLWALSGHKAWFIDRLLLVLWRSCGRHLAAKLILCCLLDRRRLPRFPRPAG